MLHRQSSEGTIVIGQPAHAWVSGQIARAWAEPFEPWDGMQWAPLPAWRRRPI